MRRPILGPTFWDLTEAFFEARCEYRRVFDNYETRVLSHAELQAVDRHQLRLEASEVSKLLDFALLGDLRNGPLHRTKEISHSLFRSAGKTSKFDRYISEIFHDLSILREEQYKVEMFAEEYKRENELAEYETLLDEVHEEFPRLVHNIEALFVKAQASLESVLRAHSRDPIYLRSLYLFGDEALGAAYPRGKLTHCWRVFDYGPAEAYMLAALSFAQGGFKTRALTVLDEAITLAGEPPPPGAKASVEELHTVAQEAARLKRLIERRTPAELATSQLMPDATEPLFGDDAAPGLGDDMGGPDETTEDEVDQGAPRDEAIKRVC